MELKDFADKKFAIYGLGFRGDNVKYLDRVIGYHINGINEKDGKKWGNFVARKEVNSNFGNPILDDYGEVIFDYNRSGNPWYIHKLIDKNFKKVSFYDLTPQMRIDIMKNFKNYRDDNIIEGTAYWWKIRIGKFWMVEIYE